MKYILVIILVFDVLCLRAQDEKSYMSISPILSHYDRVKSNELYLGDVPYNVCPGIEFLYNYKIGSFCKMGTGLSYQYASVVSHVETSDKFNFGELSIPVLFTLTEKKNRFSVETGIYAGKFLHFSWYRELHSRWEKVNSYPQQVGYKDRNAFADLYLAISIGINKSTHHPALISPFIRYRFAENWMEHYRESSYYGIKFTINLINLKKDEKN